MSDNRANDHSIDRLTMPALLYVLSLTFQDIDLIVILHSVVKDMISMEYRNWLTDLIEHAFASKAVYEVTFKIPIKVLVQVLFSYSINLVINTAK